jgi:hypothetical protein
VNENHGLYLDLDYEVYSDRENQKVVSSGNALGDEQGSEKPPKASSRAERYLKNDPTDHCPPTTAHRPLPTDHCPTARLTATAWL